MLNAKNTVRKDVDCGKNNISILMDKLSEIMQSPKRYENLTEEDVCVLLCGDTKIDTENKTIRVENLKEDKALVELANIR